MTNSSDMELFDVMSCRAMRRLDSKEVVEPMLVKLIAAAYRLIPVGYPLGNFGPVNRKPLSDIMRFDHWS